MRQGLKIKRACVLCILALMLLFSGCTGLSPVKLFNEAALPEDGILSAERVQQIIDDGAIAVFTGSSGQYTYKWTLFGTDIEAAKDLNLAVDISSEENGEIEISFRSDEDFGFTPMLAINTGTKWEGSTAAAYALPEGEQELYGVVVSGNGESTLNCSPTSQTGKVIIRDTEKEKTKSDTYVCTVSIECCTVVNNIYDLEEGKLGAVPADGFILHEQTVEFTEGETAFDVLQRVCRENKIHLESSWTPAYGSAYIEGIGNLYEFDCGSLSGWVYSVNGWSPNYGCSKYVLKPGDIVQWRYTCELGKDVGASEMDK